MAGQPEAAPFGPCCSCSFDRTRDAFSVKFSQSYDVVGLSARLLADPDLHFEVNTEMARQQYVAVLARFTGMFLFMSLCKSVCLIRGRGEPRISSVCVERARVSVTRHACACVRLV